MKKIMFIIFLSIFLSGCVRQSVSLPFARDAVSQNLYIQLQQMPDRSQVYLDVGGQVLLIEVVNTADSITQGLSGRSEIGKDGMLFVLPQKQMPMFWMKEMLFDLDLVWISQGKIVEITTEVSAPESEVSLSDLPRYAPSEPIELVLEVPAGKTKSFQWSPGVSVSLADESKYQR